MFGAEVEAVLEVLNEGIMVGLTVGETMGINGDGGCSISVA